MKKLFYALTIIAFCNKLLIAQDIVDSTLSYTTDSIIVKSERYTSPIIDTPFSIEVLDSKSNSDISNPLSLAGLLNTQAGILVNNRSNLAQGDRLSIRGIGTRAQFGIRGVKIYLDGIPLTFSDGQSQLNNLNIQEIERVEIIKGPSSVFYGNSLGGAILFSSKSETRTGFKITPQITLGSFGLKKFGLTSNYNFNDKANFSLSGYSSEITGFREHSESKYYGINFQSKFYLNKKVHLSVLSNFYTAPYLLNPSSLNKNDAIHEPTKVRTSILKFATTKKVNQFQGGINLKYNFTKESDISTTLYFVTRSLDNSIPGRIIDLDKLLGGMRIEYNNKFTLFKKEFYTLVGIDLEIQEDDRNEFKNDGISDPDNIDPSSIFEKLNYGEKIIDQDENVNRFGIFSHFHFKPTDRLSLFTGLRIDDFRFNATDKMAFDYGNISDEIKMSNISVMFGFTYHLLSAINLFGNFSSGFQTPTTNELSNNPFGDRGFNTRLKPEKVKNVELGINGWLYKSKLFSQLSIFNMRFSDLLIGYQSETEETFFRNAGEANNFGVEYSIEFFPHHNIKLYTSYTFMNFKFKDYEITEGVNGLKKKFQLAGNYLPGVPKNKLFSSLTYFWMQNLQSLLSINWIDNFFTNDFNGPVIDDGSKSSEYINDAYITFDFKTTFSHRIGEVGLNIIFAVENLLDKRYNGSIIPNAFGNNYFEPASGRSFFLTLSAKI